MRPWTLNADVLYTIGPAVRLCKHCVVPKPLLTWDGGTTQEPLLMLIKALL